MGGRFVRLLLVDVDGFVTFITRANLVEVCVCFLSKLTNNVFMKISILLV